MESRHSRVERGGAVIVGNIDTVLCKIFLFVFLGIVEKCVFVMVFVVGCVNFLVLKCFLCRGEFR